MAMSLVRPQSLFGIVRYLPSDWIGCAIGSVLDTLRYLAEPPFARSRHRVEAAQITLNCQRSTVSRTEHDAQEVARSYILPCTFPDNMGNFLFIVV